MNNLRFIGHTGEISALARLPSNSMFVLDANTVLSFIRHADNDERLSQSHFRLLLETRKRVRVQWTQRSRYIPIEPVLALMELTRQDRTADFSLYSARFNHFFNAVYGVGNFDPEWIRSVYEPVLQLIESVHQSIRETLERILIAAPSQGSLSATAVLAQIDAFLEWTLSERERLTVIGGPLLQLAVYAIAGSPNAHRFLKLQRVAREGLDAVARNVAWDLMHWVNLDFHYQRAKYSATVICSADQALIDFLLIRKNLGPRVGRDALELAAAVNSYGELNLPALSRLDNSSLGTDIAHRLLQFWQRMGQTRQDEIWFTPFQR